MTNLVDPNEFREAMRLTASGVTVVTTDGEKGRAGLTVSSLCSLSMEPPSVLICVHRENRALTTLLENGQFVANVLAAGQSRVSDSFAGIIPELREDRFSVATWSPVKSGVPALDGALCNFDCRVAQVFDFGSHRIVAGEVIGVRVGASDPLVYSDRAYRSLNAA